jgi:cell division protease FtsH
MAGSEFMEMLVGVGASRVRDLFAQAKAAAPSIIFIDEIDAIGRQRGRSGFIGGHDEREQTLNQILVEMDGFTPNDNVMVIAATNRGDLLDPALLRPGRFDRRITLDMPDKEGRKDILQIHARGKKFAKGLNWDRVAERTVGFSGADLENMLNEAAIDAARKDLKEITMVEIEEAATKVKMGPAKRRIQSDDDKKITAYHEAGHAIVTHALPLMDPVHRISIVARGMSLGHTLIPPAGDRTHETKNRLLQQISAMMGGRAAEAIVFGDITSGAASDIETATRIARAMVVDFGMSPLGPINLGQQVGYDDFGNTNWMEPSSISQAMQEKVDNEVQKIIDERYKEAVRILKGEKKVLDKVSEALLKNETLDRDEFEKIVGDKKTSEK